MSDDPEEAPYYDELHQFIGKYIQYFVSLEIQIEKTIQLFFYEIPLINAPLGKASDPDFVEADKIKSKRKELFIKKILFSNISFGFKERLDAFKFILQLCEPNFYKAVEDQKINYFDLIQKLSEFRNVLAHNRIGHAPDHFFTKREKKIVLKKTKKEDAIDWKIGDIEYRINKINKTEKATIFKQLNYSTYFVLFLNSRYPNLNPGIRPREYMTKKDIINLNSIIPKAGVFEFEYSQELLEQQIIQKQKEALKKERKEARRNELNKNKKQ